MTPSGSERSLVLEAWERMLPANDPKRDFILSGIAEGFRIIDTDKVANLIDVECENYHSATKGPYRDKVEAQIVQELQHGRYKFVDYKPKIVSAIGAIPKKGSNKVRLIHDCSRPQGLALNDYVHLDKFQYQSIQDAVDKINPGSFLAKIDLASAYRSVKLHPSNYDSTGLKWCFQGEKSSHYMVDTRLPFGAAASPKIFNELSQAVCCIMAAHGHPNVICYLDDFLITNSSFADTLVTLNYLMALLRLLGFDINYDKVEGPVQTITFLGIQLDTVKMNLSLSHSRLNELKLDLQKFCQFSKVSKRQLQSLAGKLNWATQCIYGGRVFLRNIICKINSLHSPWHRTRITKPIREDLSWWIQFMEVFNGVVPMVETRPMAPVSIDACSMGAGAYFLGDWIYTRWSPEVKYSVHINSKEILALEPAVLRWAQLWSNKKIFIHCDNMTAVSAINKGYSKHTLANQSLRRVFWWSVIYNFRLKAIYYPGYRNNIADAISRLDMPGGYTNLSNVLCM